MKANLYLKNSKGQNAYFYNRDKDNQNNRKITFWHLKICIFRNSIDGNFYAVDVFRCVHAFPAFINQENFPTQSRTILFAALSTLNFEPHFLNSGGISTISAPLKKLNDKKAKYRKLSSTVYISDFCSVYKKADCLYTAV